MKKREFFGRNQELQLLSDELLASRHSLIVVHGRRDAGKTRLVLEATAARRRVYFNASLLPDVFNIEQFRLAISTTLGSTDVLDGLDSWEACLAHLTRHSRDQHRGLVVVIDSFEKLAQKGESLVLAIRRVSETSEAREGALKIVVCGSGLQRLQDDGCPLLGRLNLSIHLRPLSFREVCRFLPGYRSRDMLDAYAAFGGIPRYLAMCDPKRKVVENVRDLVFKENGRLFEEPARTLQRELVDIRTYSGIIAAMSEDLSTSGDIARRLGVETKDIMAYLATLRRLGHVTAERSLDADQGSRDVRYDLADPLMRLWPVSVRSTANAIRSAEGDGLIGEFYKQGWSGIRRSGFLIACRQHAERDNPQRMGSPLMESGRIWSRGHVIFDVAGRLADGSRFLGLCHLGRSPADVGMLDELRRCSRETAYGRGSRTKLLIYLLNGATRHLQAQAEEDPSVKLIGLEELAGGPREDAPPPWPRLRRSPYGPDWTTR